MAAPSPRKTAARKPAPKSTVKPSKAAEKPAAASQTYTVIDDVLHYTTKAGHELAIDLDFPSDFLKLAMGTDEEDRDEDEQFEIMARTYGDNFQAAYAAMGVIERKRLQTAVFTEFQKAMGLPMGEASGSSDS